MKNISSPIALRPAIALTLCLSFVLYQPFLVTSAATGPLLVADVKSESQLRSEASRYDAAIRAISGIATMKLDTGEDLNRAVTILDRERPNLRFLRAKLVMIGLSDSSFINAVRRKAPNKQAAEAFAQQLIADPKVAATVDGTTALKSRIQQSLAADSATLRRAGERLKAAAGKFKKAQASPTANPAGSNDFKILKASFTGAQPVMDLAETSTSFALDPVSIAIIVVAIIGYAMVAYVGLKWFGPRFGIGTEEDKDQVADCQQETDDRYLRCVSEAQDLPAGFPLFLREAARAACYADWLLRQAACLTLIV
jgi:hypothetical protein